MDHFADVRKVIEAGKGDIVHSNVQKSANKRYCTVQNVVYSQTGKLKK